MFAHCARLALASLAICATQAHASSLHEQIPTHQIAALAEDPLWLGLLRYRPNAASFGRLRSNVIGDDFFLHERGAMDAQAELQATLEAMAQPLLPSASPDAHALCRFPARAQFLRAHLGWPAALPAGACPAYEAFAGEQQVSGVSLLFATGYFGNAGSVYGHVLIKLRGAADQRAVAPLLDRTINYGAAESENDSMVAYVAKGLTGRYHSRYTSLEFYQHSQRYREIELRDLWEYRLALEPEEVRMLVGNLWELLEHENHYYFLRQNCAYRIGELLEVIASTPILPAGKLWVTPMDILQGVARGRSRAGRPLTQELELHRSRFSEYRDGFAALSPAAQRYVRERIAAGDQEYELREALSAQELARAVDVLIDHAGYTAREDGNSAGTDRLDTLLRERLSLPVRDGTAHPVVPTPPHRAQSPTRAAVGWTYHGEFGPGLELDLRPANHDLASLEVGRLADSELVMGAVRVRIRSGDIALKRLDVVRLTSLNARSGALPGVSRPAWRLGVGIERLGHDSQEDSVGFVEGGLGKAQRLGGLTLYGLGMGRVNGPSGRSPAVEAGITAGLAYAGARVGVELQSTALASPTEGGLRDVHSAQLRVGPWGRWELRARADWRGSLETGVMLARYW